MRRYAASLRTRWPIVNIENRIAPRNETGSRDGSRIKTKTSRTPWTTIEVAMASHSWAWTRSSVQRKAPSPRKARDGARGSSFGIDRSPHDPQKRLLERHRPDPGGQPALDRDLEEFGEPLRVDDHRERRAVRDAVAEALELLGHEPRPLEGDLEGSADAPLQLLGRALD